LLVALLIGTLVGIILALPPGPVGVTAIKLALFKNTRSGYHLAMGNALMDFLYSIIAAFAASAAISAVESFSDEYPGLIIVAQIAIIIAFLAFGIMNLRAKPEPVDFSLNPDVAFKNKIFTYIKDRGPIFLGIGIALTNLANPTFIPTLTWVVVQLNSWGFLVDSTSSSLVFAFGFGLGNLIWISALVKLVSKYKHRLSELMLMRIRQFAGVTFIGFGAALGYRALSVTKWSEIARLVFVF